MRIIAGLKARELRWPQLDVDLSVESLEHPEGYPLVSQLPVAKRWSASCRSPSRQTRQPLPCRSANGNRGIQRSDGADATRDGHVWLRARSLWAPTL